MTIATPKEPATLPLYSIAAPFRRSRQKPHSQLVIPSEAKDLLFSTDRWALHFSRPLRAVGRFVAWVIPSPNDWDQDIREKKTKKPRTRGKRNDQKVFRSQ
jgi:hypothetical protein